MRQADLKKLHRLHSRHGRRKLDLILCEGVRCCREALLRCPRRLQFMVLDRSSAGDSKLRELRELVKPSGQTVYEVDHDDFVRLAATDHPQGVLCVLQRPPAADQNGAAGSDPLVLILDRIADPGNFGTIARTAWAAGLRQLWVTSGTVDPFGPKSIRAGMGAQFGLLIRHFPDLDAAITELARQNFKRVWRAVPDRGVNCYCSGFNLHKSGLIMGNEAHGVELPSSGPLKVRDVTIPMPGTAESLNVAQAATILLFEAVRRGLLATS